jgi:hypothetical protein
MPALEGEKRSQVISQTGQLGGGMVWRDLLTGVAVLSIYTASAIRKFPRRLT